MGVDAPGFEPALKHGLGHGGTALVGGAEEEDVHGLRSSLRGGAGWLRAAPLGSRPVALDPRTPVIVGVGQSLRKPSGADGLTEGLTEPADMMVEVLELAAADAGGRGSSLLTGADSVRVVDLLSWKYLNAAALVASRLGASPRETVQSAVGGNSPQM